MRPLLMLFVGTRGQRLADMCRALAAVADVAVVTSADVLHERPDSLEEAEYRHAVVADSKPRMVDSALEFACTHRVDGALSLGEDSIEEAAAVAAKLGLPGQPPETMPLFRDKFAQRRALAAAGVPAPAYALVSSVEEGQRALAEVGLPAIVKPTRGSGGAMTFVCSEAAHLEEVLREAFAEGGRREDEDGADGGGHGDEGEAGARPAFVVERLLVGQPRKDLPGLAPYVSVESVASGGELVHLAVTDRFPLSPPALETGMLLPSTLPPADQAWSKEIADRALRALGFQHGVAHTELMLTSEGPQVIEVNARAGGAVPYLMSMVSDLDLTAEAGRVALGLAPSAPPTFNAYGVFIGPQHPVGVEVERVDGLDEVARLPGVRAVIPLALEGTSTADFQGTMIAAVLATAKRGEDAVRLWQEVMGLVRAEYGSANIEGRHRRAPGSTSAPGDGQAVVDALPRTMRLREAG